MAEIDQIKVKKDLVEVEDLVYQMIFFAESTQDAGQTRVFVTNLSKKILEYLQIEHDDIEHLFKHEYEPYNYSSHVAKEKSDELHNTLEEQNEKIKKKVSQVPKICQKYADGKVEKDEFKEKLEKICSAILKMCGSEDHELSFVKEFMGQIDTSA